MFAYSVRRILTTIPLLLAALYLVYVGVSYTTDPLAQFYLCLPRCQEGFDRIVEAYGKRHDDAACLVTRWRG